eukprot:1086367-Pelagomonas_calceolata.AAC.1
MARALSWRLRGEMSNQDVAEVRIIMLWTANDVDMSQMDRQVQKERNCRGQQHLILILSSQELNGEAQEELQHTLTKSQFQQLRQAPNCVAFCCCPRA